MPIYMRITKKGLPLINGDVTAKGYEKWIELTSFGAPHILSQASNLDGKKYPRKDIYEVIVTKSADSASAQLLHAAMDQTLRDFVDVQIVVVSSPTKRVLPKTITFQDVIITGYVIGSGGGDEQLILNYRFIGYDSGFPREPDGQQPLPKSPVPGPGWRIRDVEVGQ